MRREGQDFHVVAMLIDLDQEAERHGAAVNTVLGGSYPYLAPEAFRHNAITEAVDIYSFELCYWKLQHWMPLGQGWPHIKLPWRWQWIKRGQEYQ